MLRAFLTGLERPGLKGSWETNTYFSLKKWTILPLSLSSKPLMSTDEVLDALERYTKESDDSDRETATKLGVNQLTLSTWLNRVARPEKCVLARLAGFLRRVGYI
jgi:transcriptional regulator with XRE-family HTH domain